MCTAPLLPIGRAPHPDRRHDRIWAWYLGAGLLVLMVSPLLPPAWRQLSYLLTSGSVIVAAMAGIRLFRPAVTTAWWLIVGTLGIAVTANLMWAVAFLFAAHGAPFPSLIDWYYLCLYGLLAAGLAAATPKSAGASRWFGAIEVAIVTCGVAVPLWTFVVQGLVNRSALSGAAMTTALMYPALDLLIFAMTARLAFLAGLRNRSRLLIVAAAAALLIGDIVFLDTLADGGPPVGGPISAVAWLSSLLLLGGAALHPSMARIHVAEPRTGAPRPVARAAVYLLLVLGGPAVTTVSLLRARTGPLPAADVVVPLLFSAALAGLLVLRLVQLADTSARRSTALQRALTTQQRLQHSLAHQASHDVLTGAANRALLNERLAAATSEPQRQSVLLMVDLDGFKDINDVLGHPTGDKVLIEVATRLSTLLDEHDTLARLGGDEFAVLLDSGGVEHATQLAGQALHLVREPLNVSGHRLDLTASVGIAPFTGAVTAAEMLRDVDLALHAAKAAGKDRHALFHPAMLNSRMHETSTIEALRHAVGRDEFTVHYQPLVNLHTGAVSSVEALLRWTSAGSDMIAPDQFIALAERSGLIVPIGAWVLRQACRDARSWYEQAGITVAVNVSARQLQDPSFIDVVLDVLADTGLPAVALTLEVTETVLAADAADTGAVVRRLQQLRQLGIRTAIDDFGTGYSSLSYLRTLPVDVLKIDRAFVPADLSDPRDTALLMAIVNLGASLGLHTVAEGVETAGQAALLRGMGCRTAQGYHYARPMPADNIAVLYAETPEHSAMAARTPRVLGQPGEDTALHISVS